MKDGSLKPSGVQIGITDRCNLSCLHCDIWKKPKREELSSSQWIKILVSLKKWLGPFRLDISGGEPFLKNDILDIIDFCRKNEIHVVITTNATLLNPKIINKLSHIKSLTLNISIDGVNSDTHDYLRNNEGVYDKAMDALLEFKKNKRICYITMATILMGFNIEEVMPLIKKLMVDNLADAINFQALDHNFSAAYDQAWFKENKMWPSGDKKDIFLSTLDGIIRIKKAGAHIYNSIDQLESMRNYFNDPLQSVNGKCNTGNINFIMNPCGDVLLCWNMAPVGNMVNGDPKKIWHSALAEKRRKDISHCVRTCRILNCNLSGNKQ
jgi:mycofactocin biosynthetic radical S-adenosylmethionine protein MftC